MSNLNRREWIGGVATVFTLVPRHVLGGPGHVAPSDRLNLAAIGVGGKGRRNAKTFAEMGVNIVALCDVDDVSAAPAYEEFPKARRYRDYRKLLEEQKDVDAVMVATPDHLHAIVTMAAMRMGKHVYTEKPMAHSVFEARELAKAARQFPVATQMGNQGNAEEGVRRITEWIDAGAVGAVREVHAWTGKPGKIWAQGVERPDSAMPAPATLDWDLWLGPAPYRPYHSCYTPFKWRGWWDFGCGALGDMGCHVLNNVFRPLRLGSPASVEAYSMGATKETGPLASMVYYHFHERDGMPPVKLTWYEGGMMPERPHELPDNVRMGDNEGVLFVGAKGKILCGCYGEDPKLLPAALMAELESLPKTLPRSPGIYQEWIDACKGGSRGGSDFEYAHQLTEMVLLGNVAVRASMRFADNGYPVRLEWDAANLKIPNMPEAEQFLTMEYRKGWSL